MKKLNMQTPDLTEANIAKIAALFPQVMTEKEVDGEIVKAIDFDLLRQELSQDLVEGLDERYRIDWPGKRNSILKANTPITKTLRPVREDSVDFDNTENLYIEGDNFEVLKVLQESYLGKVKMIYIDPPYNTGKDFVYRDNFAKGRDEYEDELGATDEEGGKLFKNTDTNGRLHSDWLSMMYERLVVARDLLKDDGVIFMSIDDNEVHNLRKIADEIFGEENFVGDLVWLKKRKGSFLSKQLVSLSENILVYFKDKSSLNSYLFGGVADENESQPIVKRTNSLSILKIPKGVISTKLPDGIYKKGIYGEGINPVELLGDLTFHNGTNINDFEIKAPFTWSQDFFDEEIKKGSKPVINTTNFQIRVFRINDKNSHKGLGNVISGIDIKGTNEDAYEELEKLMNVKKAFDYSKPSNLIKKLAIASTHFDKNALILDFFAGSGTTGDAVMQLNAEDGGNRKFIMVQLPEETDEKSEAFNAGYKTIPEIGKERIRRAGKKIVEENAEKLKEREKPLDIGFRVFKTDTTNMKDVYYHPNDLNQDLLSDLESNIKDDRTSEDLLTQVMLDLGLTLDLKIERKEIGGNEFFFVAENYLVACFDDNIDFNIVDKVAEIEPLRFVLRDSSFTDDKDRINLETRFKRLSPETNITVL